MVRNLTGRKAILGMCAERYNFQPVEAFYAGHAQGLPQRAAALAS
jgi:hypothetical protein